MGTRIYVFSRNGMRITHGVLRSERGKFLDGLRKYLPRTSFDVGLYDWRPSADSTVGLVATASESQERVLKAVESKSA